MGLYNRSFDKLDINWDDVKRINEEMVTNALIYRYRDLIINKYWFCTEFAINDDVFDKLAMIDNKNLIKLYELFTIISDGEYEERLAKYQQGKRFFYKDGYTAKYYQPDSINPVLEQSNYLIKSIEGLKELTEILSNSKVMMNDTKVENTIIQNNGIVIIDPDYYSLSNQNIDSIKNYNYKELLKLLRSIFMHYAKLKQRDILKFFDELEKNDSLDAICHIEKGLKKVNKPLDLLNLK